MAVRQAMLMKIDYVLDIVRKDRRFLNDLTRDPFRVLEESGIDLSRGELVALMDIIKGQSQSTLAPLLSKLRDKWKLILQEEHERFGRGPVVQPPDQNPSG